MRVRFVALMAALAVGLVASAVALAHSTPHWWSMSKARVMLQEGTNITLPADQRAALDAELAAWVAKLRPLLLTAQTGAQLGQDPRAGRLAQTYDSYIVRLKKLQASVNSGLSMDSAKCVGQGKALVGRFNPEKPGPSSSSTSTSAATHRRTRSRSRPSNWILPSTRRCRKWSKGLGQSSARSRPSSVST